MTQSSGWNMDRTISVGLILAVLFQAGSFIWYGAKSPPAAPTAPPAQHPSRAGPAAAVWRPVLAAPGGRH